MSKEMQISRCLALITPDTPSAADAAALVRRELTARGRRPWPAAEIEVYPGRGECLLLARPARETRMYISATALAFLSAQFDTEGY